MTAAHLSISPLRRCFGAEAAPAAAASLDPPRCPLGRVLVVDGDPGPRNMIISYLEDHQCIAVGSAGSELPHHLNRGQFSLIILNVQRGPLHGFDILRQIRASSDVPVILVTGTHQGDVDGILGLELGADDFLGKSFNPRELLARARAILRRQQAARQSTAKPPRGGYRFDGWELRRCTRILTDPEGRIVDLTKKDYALLIALLEAPRRVLSRVHLMRATRAHEDIYDRSVDVQVMRLRRKLEADPSHPELIKTKRGIGYIFDASVEVIY